MPFLKDADAGAKHKIPFFYGYAVSVAGVSQDQAPIIQYGYDFDSSRDSGTDSRGITTRDPPDVLKR
ncbi:hypothetical protein N7454_009432 [Penicillium verhagenii]|nr:hypothetical protein N7454_009432 [Penicillium verhagenii]